MSKPKGKLLIVDDNPEVLTTLYLFLQYEFETVKGIKNPNQLPAIIQSEKFDVILLDMNFSAGVSSGNEGLYWFRRIIKQDPLAVVVFITAYGDVDLAVKALKEGAADFVMKPWNNDKLVSTLRVAYDLRRSKLTVRDLQNKQIHLSEDINRQYKTIIGSSKAINDIYLSIQKVAGTEANVLISGENGTGKELVARDLHKKSKRRNDVFIGVDMTAISETLFESELFGHVKGAFTDAKEQRAGRFETASGGSLFDEISNLPIHLQAKLLTVLQNREITRLGENIPIPIDIRLICATNKNLVDLVDKGLFREDLLYRINTIQIEVPPLRERTDDIVILADHFLKQYSVKYEKPLLKIHREALNKLNQHAWPGNVRELKHMVEKAVIMSESDIIGPEDFNFTVSKFSDQEIQKPVTLTEIEKQAIYKTLQKNNWNLTNTAKELGIIRQTLYNKIKKYGL